jgi:hypothetical protein
MSSVLATFPEPQGYFVMSQGTVLEDNSGKALFKLLSADASVYVPDFDSPVLTKLYAPLATAGLSPNYTAVLKDYGKTVYNADVSLAASRGYVDLRAVMPVKISDKPADGLPRYVSLGVRDGPAFTVDATASTSTNSASSSTSTGPFLKSSVALLGKLSV